MARDQVKTLNFVRSVELVTLSVKYCVLLPKFKLAYGLELVRQELIGAKVLEPSCQVLCAPDVNCETDRHFIV